MEPDVRWRVVAENFADRATARAVAKKLRESGAEGAGVRIDVQGYVVNAGDLDNEGDD